MGPWTHGVAGAYPMCGSGKQLFHHVRVGAQEMPLAAGPVARLPSGCIGRPPCTVAHDHQPAPGMDT